MTSTEPAENEKNQLATKRTLNAAASAVLPNGDLVEMIYDAVGQKTQFVCGGGDSWRIEQSIAVSDSEALVPYSPTNNLVKHGVVLFPAIPEEYGDQSTLIARIRAFLHRYVDMSAEFELLCAYYVLYTWIADAFPDVHYIRFYGGWGTGKTRSLLTIGALCRLPIFASAASTVSPVFRLLDSFRGTLILDEGDFRYSDEHAQIIKVLNHGTSKGFPVLRTEVSSRREFDPRAYHVFGPKIIATRGFFQDRALESRCISYSMRGGTIRTDIPVNLDEDFHNEARAIRNQLLLYRLRNFKDARIDAQPTDSTLEPRLQQIFRPLLSMVDDDDARARIAALIKKYNEELLDDRSEAAEAQVLLVIRDLVAAGKRLAIQDITREFVTRYGDDYERRVTPRWVGSLVRRRLGLRPSRSTGIFTLGPEEVARLASLYLRYGIEPSTKAEEEVAYQNPDTA